LPVAFRKNHPEITQIGQIPNMDQAKGRMRGAVVRFVEVPCQRVEAPSHSRRRTSKWQHQLKLSKTSSLGLLDQILRSKFGTWLFENGTVGKGRCAGLDVF
jgi:hypothetical protein